MATRASDFLKGYEPDPASEQKQSATDFLKQYEPEAGETSGLTREEINQRVRDKRAASGLPEFPDNPTKLNNPYVGENAGKVTPWGQSVIDSSRESNDVTWDGRPIDASTGQFLDGLTQKQDDTPAQRGSALMARHGRSGGHGPSRGGDTALEGSISKVGSAVLKNAPAMFKQWGGGMLQAMAERQPHLDPGDYSPASIARSEKLFKDWDKAVAEARQAGTVPGQKMFEAASADLKANDPHFTGGEKYAYDVAQGIIQMIPALGVSALTRSPQLGAGIIGAQVFGSKYGESRDAGRSVEQSSGDASFHAAAEFLGENVPLGILMKPGGKFLARTLKAAGAESIQEFFTQLLQSGYDAGVIDENMTLGEALASEQYWKGAAYAAVVGAGVGGGLSVISHPFSGTDRKPLSDDAPQATASQIIDVAAKKKELLEGSPSLTEEQRRELVFLDDNAGNVEELARGYGYRIRPEGVIEQHIGNTPELTQDDRDSPIPDELIEMGHREIQAALGAPLANDILRPRNVPDVGTRVKIGFEDGEIEATVLDAYDGGALLIDDEGKILAWPFELLESQVITPIEEPTDEAEKEQAQEAEPEAPAPEV
ncbi:MAG: hypothetical protein E4H01_12650, partial [Lysobacterales bacterium]